MTSLSDIIAAIEEWAPLTTAQDYDNVGLQIGNRESEVARALVALDLTPDVVKEAREAKVQLVISHHPLLFFPLRQITDDRFTSAVALDIARSGISFYAAHTNLDAAKGGVSFALAELLGIEDCSFLDPQTLDDLTFGLGAIGKLERPMSLRQLLRRIQTCLDSPAPRFAGDLDAEVRTVAVCGGAGSDLIARAISAGADAYITSDLTYHRFFEALDTDGKPRLALVDAGHYETEFITEQLLIDFLSSRFPKTEWIRTKHRTTPIQTMLPVEEPLQ